MKTRRQWLLIASFSIFIGLPTSATAKGPYLTTGIKICEVDASSAIIWTRLTRLPERVSGNPVLTFRHYSVDGDVLNEDRIEATK